MSGVRTFPELITSYVEVVIELAMASRLCARFSNAVKLGVRSAYPKCLSIMVADKIIAAGLALLAPLISFAT